ncbi:YggT family protein [Bordetella avium]|uniref:YggT family protein n=1 Tax=Bordetella avium TaxID=521 RepID=UPI0039FBB950
MIGDIFGFIIDILFTLFGAALLLRAWMHAVRLHPFNPLARTIYQCTNWLVLPLRRVIPATERVDWSSLFAAWLAALVFFILLTVAAFGALPSASGLPRILLVALLTEVRWALNLIVWLTLIQAVLSWVNPMSPIMPLLQTLSAPILNPIRRILPRTSIDFSPLVVLLLAQVLIMLLTRLSYLA